MLRRLFGPICIGLFGTVVLLISISVLTSAATTLEPADGNTTVESETYPVNFEIRIVLDGSIADQVDYIICHPDINSTQGVGIGGSSIALYLDQDNFVPATFNYQNPGDYTIEVEIFNNSYPNGTEKPQEEKLIEVALLNISLLKIEPDIPELEPLASFVNVEVIAYWYPYELFLTMDLDSDTIEFADYMLMILDEEVYRNISRATIADHYSQPDPGPYKSEISMDGP